MQGGAVNLGSCIAGIPVTLHYSFFLLLVIELLSTLKYREPLFTFFVFLLYGPILLVTILVHEYGHALITRKLGGEVGGIVLWPLGGFALCGPTDKGPSGDLKVAIAGPLTHIPMILFWVIMYAAVSGGDWSSFSWVISLNILEQGFTGFMSILCEQSIYLNLILMLFNLLIPAYPLDGGRCFAATLLLCGFNTRKAAMATSVLGMLIAACLAFWGLVSFFGEDNPTGIFTLLIAVFIFHSSYNLFSLTKEGRVNEHPLFGRPCFEETENVENSGGDGPSHTGTTA